MKTLISSALIALAAAAPVAAQQVAPGAAGAIAHFNQDFSTQDGRIDLDHVALDGVAVSSRSGALGSVFERFNADFSTQDGIRGQNGATLISGTPAYAADIHAAIRAEGLENE
jgi:hypothetical protein